MGSANADEEFEALKRRDEETFAAILDRDYPTTLYLASVLHPERAREVARAAWLGVADAEDLGGAPTIRALALRGVVHPARAPMPPRTAAEPDARFEPEGDLWEGHWADSVHPWSNPDEATLRAEVSRGLANLPPLLATIVLLRDVGGLTGDEVEWILGLGDDDQRVLLHDGRSAIRDAISGAPA